MDAAGSVNHYVQSIRDMARELDQSGFTGRAADLRRTMLAQYWMASTGTREACTRRLLQGLTASGGHLEMLRWLPGNLSRRGIGLSAGTIVSTGSLTGVHFVRPDDGIVADLGPLGRLSVMITD